MGSEKVASITESRGTWVASSSGFTKVIWGGPTVKVTISPCELIGIAVKQNEKVITADKTKAMALFESNITSSHLDLKMYM
jgi:hypothetical protein